MSLAAQANEKLSQLVSLAIKIEGHLQKKDPKKDNAQQQQPPPGGNVVGGGGGNIEKEAVAIGGMSTALAKLIEATDKLKPGSAKKLSEFISNMVESISEAAKQGFGDDNATKVMDGIKVIAESSFQFMKEMAKSAILGIPALIGATLFGATIRVLSAIISKAKILSQEGKESIEGILEIGKKSFLFGLSMAAWAIVGIPAVIGATLFGLSVMIITKIFSLVSGRMSDIEKGGDALRALAVGAALFGLAMVGISFVADQFTQGTTAFITNVAKLLLVVGLLGTFFGRGLGNTLEGLSKMGWGALLFASTMVLIGLVAPQFMKGVLTFTMGVAAMLAVFGILGLIFSKGTGNALEALNKMGVGAALFALTMVGIGLVAPLFAMGVIAFTLGVGAMLLVFGILGFLPIDKSVEAINKIGTGAAIFTLTMVAIGLLIPLFARGVLAFVLGIGALLLVMGIAALFPIDKAANVLKKMQWSVVILSLTFIAVGMLVQPFAIGVLAVVLGLTAMFTVLAIAGKRHITITKGISVLNKMLLPVALFGIAMALAGLAFKQIALGALVLSLAIIAIGFSLEILGRIEGKDQSISNGVTVLNKMIVPVGAFGLMLAVTTLLMVGDPLTLALKVGVFALGIAALGGATALVGMMDKQGDVTKGIPLLYELAPSLIAFSVAMFILAAAPGSPEDLLLKLGVVAASIVVLGFAAYAIGLPLVEPFVLAGAFALMALGGALVIFSAAMYILAKTEMTAEKGAQIGGAIWEIGWGVAKLGLISIGVLFGSAVLLPMTAALMAFSLAVAVLNRVTVDPKQGEIMANLIVGLGAAVSEVGSKPLTTIAGAAALLLIGAAMIPLSMGLTDFKKVGWQQSDSESLKTAVTGVVQAFAHSLDGLGITGILKLMAAIPLIAAIGGSLMSLAAGVKSMATLTFTEMEYDEKEKKLIPKRQVKLTNEEIQAVGPNVNAIITALIEPLGKLGSLEGTTEVGFTLPSWLGGGKGSIPLGKSNIERGIDIAGKIGGVISSIAHGVKRMANMEVIEYEVAGRGTDRKLVPKGSRKLTPDDFTAAHQNTAAILTNMTKPLSDFGKAMSDENSGQRTATIAGFTFDIGPSYIDKGIEAASKIGSILGDLAKGVADMASGTVVEYGIAGKGVNAKLVPKATRKLQGSVDEEGNPTKGSDYERAANNVKAILVTLQKPLGDFGAAMQGGSLFFGIDRGYIEQGIDAVAKITDPISKLADMVIKMAAGEAVVNEIKDDGKGGKKIVPSGIIKFSDALTQSKENVKLLLTNFSDALTEWAKSLEEKEDSIDVAVEQMPKLVKMVEEIAKIANSQLNMAKSLAEAKEVWTKAGMLAPLDEIKTTTDKLWGIHLAMLPLTVEQFESYAEIVDSVKSISNYIKDTANNLGGVKKEEASGKFITTDLLEKFATSISKINGIMTEVAVFNIETFLSSAKILNEVSFVRLGTTRYMKEAAALGINPGPILLDYATNLKAISDVFNSFDERKVNLYHRFANITEGLMRINTPFEKFTKLFGQFAKDMGVFVKNWEEFGKDNADNLKSYADSLKQLSMIDVGALRTITQEIGRMAVEQGKLNTANAAAITTPNPTVNATVNANTKTGAGAGAGTGAVGAGTTPANMTVQTLTVTNLSVSNLSPTNIIVAGKNVKLLAE